MAEDWHRRGTAVTWARRSSSDPRRLAIAPQARCQPVGISRSGDLPARRSSGIRVDPRQCPGDRNAPRRAGGDVPTTSVVPKHHARAHGGAICLTNTKLKGCPSCAAANGPVIPAIVEGAVHRNNGKIACDGTTPFGDVDDTGFVPTTKPIANCESSVGKNVGKLVKGLLTCHIKTAGAGLKGKPFDEEARESTEIGKFNAANIKLKGCPACLDTSFFPLPIELFLDSENEVGDRAVGPSRAVAR